MQDSLSPLRLFSGGVDTGEQLPVGFRAPPPAKNPAPTNLAPTNYRSLGPQRARGGQAAQGIVAAPQSMVPSPQAVVPQGTQGTQGTQPAAGLTERTVKVDPDVAFESGLCTRCEPSRPQPWESGALLWIQIAFAALLIVIIALLIACTALCIKYVQQHAHAHRSSSSH